MWMRNSRTQRRSLAFALYLNAALLIAILVVLLSRNGSSFPQILPAAYAQNQQPIAGGAGVFITPAQFAINSYGVYLMDVDAQTLCAYQFDGKQLRLLAARNFRWDRRLGRFNSGLPSPEEAKQIYDLEQNGGRVLERPTEKPSVEAPAKQD